MSVFDSLVDQDETVVILKAAIIAARDGELLVLQVRVEVTPRWHLLQRFSAKTLDVMSVSIA
jgi:hypothetical protein